MSIKTTRTNTNTRKVRPGDPIRVGDQNSTRAALEAIQQIDRQLKLSRPRPWAESMLHEVVTIQSDYLECVRVWRSGTLGSETVYVAKPRLLRGSLATRDGVSYVYIGTDRQNRTASKAGENDEDQYVTPVYLVGDLIEVEIARGATGITEVDEQRGRPIDKNVDGRAWATAPAT